MRGRGEGGGGIMTLKLLGPHYNRFRSVAPEPALTSACDVDVATLAKSAGAWPTRASEMCMVLSAMLPWAASMAAEAQAALAATPATVRSRNKSIGTSC